MANIWLGGKGWRMFFINKAIQTLMRPNCFLMLLSRLSQNAGSCSCCPDRTCLWIWIHAPYRWAPSHLLHGQISELLINRGHILTHSYLADCRIRSFPFDIGGQRWLTTKLSHHFSFVDLSSSSLFYPVLPMLTGWWSASTNQPNTFIFTIFIFNEGSFFLAQQKRTELGRFFVFFFSTREFIIWLRLIEKSNDVFLRNDNSIRSLYLICEVSIERD